MVETLLKGQNGPTTDLQGLDCLGSTAVGSGSSRRSGGATSKNRSPP